MAKTSKRGDSASKLTAAAQPELPGATLTWVLIAGATLWFAGRLWAMRGTLLPAVAATGVDSATVSAIVIFALPTLISAALLVGASLGLGAVLWRRATERSWRARLLIGGAAGLVAAGVTAGALMISGSDYPGSMVTAAISVAVAALLGGVIAAVRVPALAAGLAGALTVAAIQFVAALFTSDLRGLLDGSGTGPEVADAERRLAMIVGVVAGIAAGIVSAKLLARLRQTNLGEYVLSGAAAGILLLIAEVISRIAQPLMVGAVGGRTGDDPLVLQLAGEARLNAGLLVLFAGAITAVIVLGRSRRSRPRPSVLSSQATGTNGGAGARPARTGTTSRGAATPAKRPAAKRTGQDTTEPAADDEAPTERKDSASAASRSDDTATPTDEKADKKADTKATEEPASEATRKPTKPAAQQRQSAKKSAKATKQATRSRRGSGTPRE